MFWRSGRRLIASASGTELEDAHRIWVGITGVTSSLFRFAGSSFINLVIPQRYAPAINFGGVVIHAILLANRLGLSENIKKTLVIFETIANRNADSGLIFQMRVNPLGTFSEAEIAAIQQRWDSAWIGTDVGEIWDRLIHDRTLKLEN
jgi:hypothetical protein